MMETPSIICGLLLLLIGIYGYYSSESKSPTALIPAFIGLPIFVLGLFFSTYNGVVLYIDIALLAIGIIGSGMRVIPSLSKKGFSKAVKMQLAMFAICTIFLLVFILRL